MRDRYDDGGFSGGSMERPALKKLLDAVRARRIDVIVVYKVDRLTRSLADFAKLVELFDEHRVSSTTCCKGSTTHHRVAAAQGRGKRSASMLTHIRHRRDSFRQGALDDYATVRRYVEGLNRLLVERHLPPIRLSDTGIVT
jgi:hypothetical protein